MSEDVLALLAEIDELEAAEMSLVPDTPAVRVPKHADGIIASILFTQDNLRDAIMLCDLLEDPKSLHNFPKNIRLKGEIMWRKFGSDINIQAFTNNGWFNFVGGDKAHIVAFAELFGINT